MSRTFVAALVPLFSLTLLFSWSPARAANMTGARNRASPESLPQKLFLIPTPRKIFIHPGEFRISAIERIVLARPADRGAKFAAGELADEIWTDLKIKIATGARRSRNYFLMGRIGKDRAVNRALHELRISVPDSLGDQGYILNISHDRVLVAANTSTGVFYGIQTLKQIIRADRKGNSIPCLTIVDWPGLEYRGWMDDISRGPIPTMDLLKKEIRTLAGYKLNFLTLYTENVFKLKAFPDLAPEDGLTADQVRELTEYAALYHVQVVGNFQSFGHQYNILSHPFYHEMRETENVLSPIAPQTYTYLEKVYSEIVPAYSSKFFNINCDETFELGEGKAKAWVDSAGLGAVYAYHINKVYDLLKPYHKQIMMWGDIADQDTSIVGMIPKDIIMLPWNYSPDKSFDHMIVPFVSEGFKFMVSPGVGCWSEIWPSMESAVVNISNFVRDGAKYGAMGMLNTAWDDDGENFFNYNWHGLIWGAECSWKPAPPDTGEAGDLEMSDRLSHFNDSFNAVFYGNSADSVAQTLFRLNAIREIPVRNILDDPGFWKEPLAFQAQNSNDSDITNNTNAGTAAVGVIAELERSQKTVERNAGTLDYAIFAARRVEFETKKNIFSIRLRQAIMSGDSTSLSGLKTQIDPLLDELHSLEMEYVRLWEKENRTWWLNKILAKYDKLGNRLINLDRAVMITPSNELVDGRRAITLSTVFHDRPIYYTTDGTAPTLGANVYTGPFTIDRSTPIHAGVPEYGQVVETAHEYVLVDKAIGTLYRLESHYSTYNPAYSAGGDSALVDGLLGSTNFADGRWQGYQGQNLSLVLDLKKITDVKSVAIRFLQNSYSWVLMPKDVKVFFSDDGKNFQEVKDIANTIDPKLQGTIIHRFTAEFDSSRTRYIRIVGVYPGPLPAWHQVAGSPSFMFADEVIVR